MDVEPFTARVMAFLDAYDGLYEQHRGVAYFGSPIRDYQAACALCRKLPHEVLVELATVCLLSDDPFLHQGTLTIGKFRSRVSWCAERLAAEKQKRGMA